MRGVPDLLVIYIVFFGGSEVLTSIGHALGRGGFFGLNGFVAGALAVGIVSGAYQTGARFWLFRAVKLRRRELSVCHGKPCFGGSLCHVRCASRSPGWAMSGR